MNQHRILVIVAIVVQVVQSSTALAAKYKAILLQPSFFEESVGWGASQGGQVGFAFGKPVGDPSEHAILWRGNAESAIDLNPPGFKSSRALGISGEFQVGRGANEHYRNHALLWNGSPDSAIDLNPIGYESSTATAIWGDHQVGGADPPNAAAHALLWNGTAESAIDLHPEGYVASWANGVWENVQVGVAVRHMREFDATHAMIWHGSAQTAVDLNPPGFDETEARGVWGDYQVGSGYGISTTSTHALLWRGTAESVVDLHPEGYFSSEALAVAGDKQVGYANDLDVRHAMVWSGSSESVVDLHPYLEDVVGYFNDIPLHLDISIATGIGSDGTIVGEAVNLAYSKNYAVMWIPIPEPSSTTLLLLLLVGLATYRIK